MTMKIRLAFMTLLLLGAVFDLFFFHETELDNVNAENSISTNELKNQQMKVILQLFYIDGEVKEEIVTENNVDMDELWSEYKEWNLVDINTEHVIFQKYINDISPLLKANGFFGLSEDGSLSVFNGKPDESNIIHSFYQIDTEKLETKIQAELKKGIPVKDKTNYQNVINAFKPYSLTADQ